MATASEVITSARYDLRDTNSLAYTDPELLDYLNRSVVQLDSVLSALNSDRVFTEDTGTTLASAANSVSVPTRCMKVRQLWIGTTQKIQKPLEYIFYERRISSSNTGEPNYYCEHGDNIEFELTADADYSLYIYYDQASATLETSTTMPYSDEFNELLREGVILLAKRRNEYDVNLDAVLHDYFLEAAMAKVIKRRHKRPVYRLGF